MKILITGNPAFNSLCRGLQTQLSNHELTFISRGLGHDLTNIDWVVEQCMGFDVFINSTNIPDSGQLKILNKLYDHPSLTHIINVSTTRIFWNNKTNYRYFDSKTELESRSKELSNECINFGKKLRVSCIAYGDLDSTQNQKETPSSNKIDLEEAAFYIKMIVESPKSYNINYICLDPVRINQ